MSWDSVILNFCAKNLKAHLHGEETYRNFKPKRWKRNGKVRKCYSDLTGKNSYILICYLSTLIAKECGENMIVT